MLPQNELESTGVTARFHYSDGHTVLRTFASKKQCDWFAYNEGDHLLKVEIIAG
jgi:hypothetical protein